MAEQKVCFIRQMYICACQVLLLALCSLMFNGITEFDAYNNQFGMSKTCFGKILLILAIFLVGSAEAYDWQGTGNLNNENLTIIWMYIETNLSVYIMKGDMNGFSHDLSVILTNLWSPAWNVFTIQTIGGKGQYDDTIFYGYAFKNHWVWFNGYEGPAGWGNVYSFIIWKDYNCQGWKDMGFYNQLNQVKTGFNSTQQQSIKDTMALITIAKLQEDIWGAAFQFMTELFKKDGFTGNHAYSIVMSQSATGVIFYGRACTVGDNYYYAFTDSEIYGVTVDPNFGLTWGNFVLFQTR